MWLTLKVVNVYLLNPPTTHHVTLSQNVADVTPSVMLLVKYPAVQATQGSAVPEYVPGRHKSQIVRFPLDCLPGSLFMLVDLWVRGGYQAFAQTQQNPPPRDLPGLTVDRVDVGHHIAFVTTGTWSCNFNVAFINVVFHGFRVTREI